MPDLKIIHISKAVTTTVKPPSKLVLLGVVGVFTHECHLDLVKVSQSGLT